MHMNFWGKIIGLINGDSLFEDVKKAKAFVKKYKGSGNKYEVVKRDVEYLDTFLREAHAMGIETLLIGKNRKARGYDISGLMEKLKEFAT